LNIIPKIGFGSNIGNLKGDFIISVDDDYKFNYVFNNKDEIVPDGEPYLYWELFNDKIKTYSMKGTYIPNDYDKNYENDILEQSISNVKWGNTIIFDYLKHINTSVTVNLIKGKGFYEGEWDINNIKIKGVGIYKTDVIFQQNKPVIIKPIKLNNYSEFVINLLGNDIRIKLNTLTINNNLLSELEVNINYVFNLTIDKTGSASISISYSDTWNNKEIGGTIIY
jgi:hypothetical protein